jgi:hypothetical protein
VALANKTMRIAWALLAHGRPYEADHVSLSPRARSRLTSLNRSPRTESPTELRRHSLH